MKIDQSTNDQLMVIAAFRYCLGRQSYIVGACLDWLPTAWDQLTTNTQSVIVRDTFEALFEDRAGSPYCDVPGWQRFVRWAWARLTDQQRAWITSDTRHKGRVEDYLEAQP